MEVRRFDNDLWMFTATHRNCSKPTYFLRYKDRIYCPSTTTYMCELLWKKKKHIKTWLKKWVIKNYCEENRICIDADFKYYKLNKEEILRWV